MALVNVESFFEFSQRHGGDPVPIGTSMREGRVLLFADGASANDTGTSWMEPPEDPWEKLRLRKQYTEAKLQRAEEEFLRVRSQFSEQASLASRYPNLPPPPHDAPAILKGLRRIVKGYRAELALIERQLENSPKAKEEALRKELADRSRRRVAELAGEIHGLTLDGDDDA